MRYIHYLLFCFTLLFVQGAHAFYCIETINGTEYPTLYAVSGESWADVEKREGCTFTHFKRKITDRSFEKFTKSSKTNGVNTSYPIVKMKLSDGTLVELTNIVVFEGYRANLHYLNSEAKFENINNASRMPENFCFALLYTQHMAFEVHSFLLRNHNLLYR